MGRRGRTLRPDEHVNWQVWGRAGRGHSQLWRTFLAEQRALMRELESAVGSVRAPVLLLADPEDAQVPVGTARRLAQALPDARLQLVEGAGHPPAPARRRCGRRCDRDLPGHGGRVQQPQDEALFPAAA